MERVGEYNWSKSQNGDKGRDRIALYVRHDSHLGKW